MKYVWIEFYVPQKWQITFPLHKQAFLQNVQCFFLVAFYYIQIYSVMCRKESWRESRRAGDCIKASRDLSLSVCVCVCGLKFF
jgi:hypothetical protein